MKIESGAFRGAEYNDEKKEKFLEIITSGFYEKRMPEIIFVLGPGISKKKGKPCQITNNPRDYKSTPYKANEEDHLSDLVAGGKARVISAAALGETFPELKFVVNSSAKRQGEPTEAAVVESELHRWGVKEDKIILQEKSTTTFTELKEMVKMAVENNWQRIAVITNDYHIPRCLEMLKKIKEWPNNNVDTKFENAVAEFLKREIEISFISAEDVLISKDGRYKKLLDKVHESESYRRRMESEEKGIEDLKSGKYKLGD